MNGEARGIETVECVKIKPGQVHVLGAIGCFQTVEPDENTFLQLNINPTGFSRFEKFRQRFTLERLDHDVCKLITDK